MSCTIRRLIYNYRVLKCEHPILVSSIQMGFIMGIGDIIAQKFVEEQCEIDFLRTAKMAAIGAIVVGPTSALWFRFLNRKIVCPPCKECSKFSLAFKKIILTELLYAPFISAAVLTAAGALNGRCSNEILQDLNEKWWDIVKADWVFWPFVHFVRYMFFPMRHQGFIFKGAMIIWGAYLSWKIHRDECSELCCVEECEEDD